MPLTGVSLCLLSGFLAAVDLASHLEDRWPLYTVALYLVLLAFKTAVKHPHTTRTVAIAMGLVTIPAAALVLARPPALATEPAMRNAWAVSRRAACGDIATASSLISV